MPLINDSQWLRPLAQGERFLAPEPPHRLQLFFQALTPLFSETAEFVARVPAIGGLQATAWRTREHGSVVFIENPTENRITGAVFPAIASITLEPGQVVARVHDLPIGPTDRYLSAYAGLVACEASFLTAHIRPDPYIGARIFVRGAVEEKAKLVLFGGGRGEEIIISFTEQPAIYNIAESQIVAIPDILADTLYLPENPQSSDTPTLIGKEWLLWPDGTLEQPADWPEGMGAGWLWTRLSIPAETGACIDGIQGSLWLNGAPADPADLALPAGESTLLVHTDTSLNTPLLVPDGACYLLDLHEWHQRPLQSAS
ncbi:MAG: hypothetical protein QM758_23960 [Armatimonas sp.]